MERPNLRRVLISSAILSFALTAPAKLARTGEPLVSFTAIGPAGLKIKGESHDLLVVDRGADLSVKIPLGGLKTGISLRDSHMREKYLQVEQYPAAELMVSRDAIKLPNGGAVSIDAKGTLSLHGKTKPVTFHYDAKRSGSAMHVNGTLRLNIKEFGIDVPSYAGITVKPDVDVAVEFDVQDS
ncbi:MAG TPA: YceI family protein [Polyangiaceae bacterium]